MKWSKKMKRVLCIIAVFTIFSLSVVYANAQDNSNLPAQNQEHQIIINEPPSGWNPETASDQEISKYGYPERPKDSQALSIWKSEVNGKWFSPKFTVTNILRKPDISLNSTVPNLNSSQTINTTSTSYIWAGVVSHPGTQARANGFWRQPVATAVTGNRPAYSSQWIGLGGRYESVLIQCGTESNIFPDGSGGYNVWYEIVGTNLNANQINISNFTHTGGDTYYADISFTKGTSGSANFYIKDITSNAVTSFTVTNIQYNNDLTTSEWIYERPNIGGSTAANLTKPDVGYDHFSQIESASTPTGTSSLISGTASTTDYRSMVSSDGLRTMANPGTVDSNGAFDDTWHYYN